MNSSKPLSPADTERRRRAEVLARENAASLPATPEAVSPEALRQTLYELQVHQIELELQNEELRRAQLELDAVRERYFHLYDQAPVGYCTVSETGLIREANLTAAALLGVARGALAHRPLTQFILPADQDDYYRHRHQLLKSGTPQDCDLRIRKADGGSSWTHLTMVAALDAADPAGYWVTLSDITERKQAAEALEQLNAQLEQRVRERTAELSQEIGERKKTEMQLRQLGRAVEQSPTVIVITDHQGTIQYVNPRFEIQTGYTAAEAVGQNPRMLRSGTHPPEFFDSMWRTLLADQIWRGELCNKRKDGTLIWESTAIAAIRDAEGRLTHFVATKEDITERRRLAAELCQAKDIAETANRAKSTFLANMSHELRTPMNAVLGFAQLLLRDAQLTALQRRQLTTIHRSGEHLMGLINGILEFARIESGRVSLNPAPFDFHRLLDDLEHTFIPAAQAKQLRLLVQRQAQLPRWLVADAGKLRQVITNLLGNAIRFTPSAGKVMLRVGAHAEPDGAIRLSVAVEDSGPGIAPEDLPRLFKPFFQTAAGQDLSGGTGLGLAISQQLARLMGGDCTVQSQVGVGSTFAFDVRVERVAEECAGPETRPGRNVLRLLPDLAACRVLVADDDAANRELLEEMLRPIGFEIRTAVDGAQAVAQCQAWRPHLVLMDLRMPVMDGFEATRQIRAAHGAAVKIMALSAGVLEENQQQALAAGVDVFLAKPFREAELLETIKGMTGVEFEHEFPPGAAAGVSKAAPEPAAAGIGQLAGRIG